MWRWIRVRFKRLLPRGLFARSILIIVTPIVLLQAVITWVFFERQFEEMTRRLSLSVAGEISMLVEAYREFPDAEQDLAQIARETMSIEVAFLPGETLPPPTQRPFYDIVGQTLAREVARAVGRPIRLDTTRFEDVLDIRIQVDEGVLRVLAPRKRFISSKWHFLLVWMVIASIVLTTVSVLFLRGQVRPIRQLAQAAEDFGKGRQVDDFRPSGATEVRRAAIAFMDMRDRIRRQIDQRTTMLAGVSHDLRTPLTRMKLGLALLPRSEEVEELERDVTEMQQMLDAYLAFARGERAEEPEDTDLERLAADICQNARRKGADVSLAAEIVRPATARAHVRPGAITRLLTNLVDNAARHGDRVRVTLRAGGPAAGAVEIVVEDDGPGIPAEEREDAFKPFNRLDPARTPERGGVGLGLTIARDIARAHGGDVTLGESAMGGLRATVRLPA
ncbi:MAG: HAMP domain-containing protein [Alphaproteobacteria bacterium]|nr:HAMP domain-containing protein [Alphaproteobacteria bacterium]MDX5370326.1 HAMP domain-containing protein [Alphaproteobacteria bacterium]MDX5464862.1 HAMP domain-containing protein [Alphaproteobacteria bacterium]